LTDYQTVLVTVADHVATVTLNRPDRLNAFDQAMLDEFASLWAWVRADDDVHAVVLRAAGERAFSTGVDRKGGRFRHPNPWSEDDPGAFLGPKQNRVWKPVIAALHGMVAGGAFYWVNEADIVICAEDTTFFDPHVTYGMTSALEPAGMVHRMPLGEVLRIVLLGLDERMSAARALQIGLVSEVLDGGGLWPRADELAHKIAAKPPLAVQGSVKAVWDALEMTPRTAREVHLVYPQLANPLAAEQSGLDSFAAKDRPKWELR
jgi:enoyl-CoA hydratase/carnithine racemase